MKILFVSFVLLSIICGLNGHCVRHHPGEECRERVFPEPEQRDIHYIYHGETCACPKHHDVIVQKAQEEKQQHHHQQYEYGVDVPHTRKHNHGDDKRYIFDVRVEKPEERVAEERREHVAYNVEIPYFSNPDSQSVRYIFDGRVEEPVKPCEQKPWQGLVAQVDRVLVPAKGCQNSDHTPETCNCGSCGQCGQKQESCSCGSSCGCGQKPCACGNDSYKLPINYNSRYEMKSDDSQNFPVFTFPDSMNLPRAYEITLSRQKRGTNDRKRKSKRREIALPKLKPLKKISSKSIKPLEPLFKRSKKSKAESRQSRPKRGPNSPCSYTYESCDPKKHSRNGCPLCYKCKCEPVNKDPENAKFSPRDIKIPYKVVTHNEAPGSAATNQEFDHEPSSYTGLRDQQMYQKYIGQIISKYPEHMSRKMPDIQDQQKDLMKFIGELATANKSPAAKIEGEDIRYKIMDNAMDMYKYYEKALSGLPKGSTLTKDGKLFKKRGTVLEVIELDPEDYNGSAFGVPIDELGDNYSASQ